jgi:hypothetical protein
MRFIVSEGKTVHNKIKRTFKKPIETALRYLYVQTGGISDLILIPTLIHVPHPTHSMQPC